jgi:hypothetical protein
MEEHRGSVLAALPPAVTAFVRWSESPKQVVAFYRSAWSDCAEIGGRIQPKRAVRFTPNPQPASGTKRVEAALFDGKCELQSGHPYHLCEVRATHEGKGSNLLRSRLQTGRDTQIRHTPQRGWNWC